MRKTLFAACTVAAVFLAQDSPPAPKGTVKGIVVQQPAPIYPSAAKEAGIEGVVALPVRVSKAGNPINIRVESGDALLRQAALDAVKQWKFSPKIENGQPVEFTTQIDVPFKLN